MWGIWRIASSHRPRVTSVSARPVSGSRGVPGMPNPITSVDEEPRPVPSSNRPFDSTSIMAARSAERTGWFTGAVMLKMADPRCTFSVVEATADRNTSGEDMWEYSRRKWCSEAQMYLNPLLSQSWEISRLSRMRWASQSGLFS